MIVIVRHHKNYDWRPVPRDVSVKQGDIVAGLVKPGAREGEWLMKVTVDQPGFTTVTIPERELCERIVYEAVKPGGGRVFSRKDALANLLSELVLPNHCHRSWVTGFEVHDDGPHSKTAEETMDPHFECGNMDKFRRDEWMAAYNQTQEDHVGHLCATFRVRH